MRLITDIYIMKWQKKKSSESVALNKKSQKPGSGISEAIGKGFAEDAIIKLRKKLNGNLHNEKDLRNRALLDFLLATGLRADAVVNAKFSSLVKTPQKEFVLEYIAKGGKTKYIAIEKQVIKLIEDYHRLCGFTHDYFFVTLPTNANPDRHPMTTRALQGIIEIWGLRTLRGKSGHPHAFRHTVGQALTDVQGVGTAQVALGHENIQTTERFYINRFVNPSKILKDKWKGN
jgi:integrase